MKPTHPQPVSLKMVAARAGCSVSAVATVLNKIDSNSRIGAQLRARIERAGEELGYRRNYLARALRTGRSQVLGVALGLSDPGLAHEGFWSRFLSGVDQAAREHGCDLLSIGSHAQQDALDRGLRLLAERQLDALVVPSLIHGGRLAAVEAVDGPIAVAFGSEPIRGHPRVRVSHQEAISAAVEHLAGLGHAELCWLEPPAGSSQGVEERRHLLASAARERQLRVRICVLEPEGTGDGPSLWRAGCLQALAQAPTAFVAFSEAIALGALQALAERGTRVPGEVSLLTFDDILARWVAPPLTAIDIAIDEVGRIAGRIALRRAEDPACSRELAGKLQLVPARLVVRASTGPARPAS